MRRAALELAFALAVVTACALLLTCCASITEPDFRAFEPPAWYGELHAELEDCAGLSRPFQAVSWYVADPSNGHTFTCRERDQGCGGRWVAPSTIQLAEGNLGNYWLVTHELTHYLLQDGSHRNPVFETCQWTPLASTR